jgi:prophage regulatory protein
MTIDAGAMAGDRGDAHANGLAPLLVSHRRAAKLCGVSGPTWHRRVAAGDIGPEPVRLGGRVLWRLEELERWVAAGCPDRRTWQALQAGNGRPR